MSWVFKTVLVFTFRQVIKILLYFCKCPENPKIVARRGTVIIKSVLVLKVKRQFRSVSFFAISEVYLATFYNPTSGLSAYRQNVHHMQ